MLISIDWIKDFVDLNEISPEELGRRFTLGAAEVEGVEITGEHFEKISVAQIEEINQHPNADKLNLVTFRVSENETKEVVCGAQNVAVGMKVAFAPLGTTLPNGLTLEPKKIRGVLSDGMLCSEAELGYAESSDGIMSLPEDAPLGQSLAEYFQEKKNVLLDVDNKSLTHRPDLWGYLGIAREFAAIFQKDFKNPYDKIWESILTDKFTNEPSPISPKIEGDCSCLAYYGLSVDNVEVKESPDWMKKRLLSVGLRPINNIVDISNYVMLELGIPLHIFDREKIKGNQLIIKRIGIEDEFVTLDEEKRKLIPTDTVICDETEPLVLAGIMGGLSSGVVNETKNVFIEVANWKAAEVRRTSTRLGLRTDSSQRYEKTLDSNLCKRTMLRTLQLIMELCPEARVVGNLEYDGLPIVENNKLVITTSVEKINKVLGCFVEEERIHSIFAMLDFECKVVNEALEVTIPTYRSTKDIECEADLIEEVGRIIGYDNIAPESPLFHVFPTHLSSEKKLARKISDFLVYNSNAYEVYTYPMVGKKLLDKALWEEATPLKILNALSEEHDRMRPTMIPGLLDAVALNQKNYSEFKFFEIGKSYIHHSAEFSNERDQLAVVFYSKTAPTYLDLVNNVERMLLSTGLPGDVCERHPKVKNNVVPENWKGCHPHEYLNVRVMGKLCGAIFSIHPLVLRAFKVKGNVSMAIVDLTDIKNAKIKDKLKFKPLLKFPSSSFDCTVVVDKDTPVGDLIKTLKKVKVTEMVDCKIMDVYQLNDQQKSVTLQAVFADEKKTLPSEVLENAQNKIVESLNKAGYPLKV